MISRLRIIETRGGSNSGWYVEVEGRKLARLVEPRWEDMFWTSYRVEPLTEDPQDRALLASATFWFSGKPVYRSCEFNVVVPFAFAGGDAVQLETGLRETGRVSMRGLYLVVPRYPWDGLLLWLRRRWNKHRKEGQLAR